MEHLGKSLLFWAPRGLCFLFALFLSLFAMDVFGEGRGVWGTAVALFMHLIWTWIMLGVLAVSWRWGWVATLLCFSLGVFYLISTWGRFHWSAYALISGSLFLIGSLFLVDRLFRARLRPN